MWVCVYARSGTSVGVLGFGFVVLALRYRGGGAELRKSAFGVLGVRLQGLESGRQYLGLGLGPSATFTIRVYIYVSVCMHVLNT